MIRCKAVDDSIKLLWKFEIKASAQNSFLGTNFAIDLIYNIFIHQQGIG